jgi:hypothetical protein
MGRARYDEDEDEDERAPASPGMGAVIVWAIAKWLMVAVAVSVAIAGLASSTPTGPVTLAGFACFAAILARLAQVEENQAYYRATKK